MGGKSTLRTRQKGKKAPTVAKLKKTAWKLLSECIRREAADQAGNVACYTCGRVWGWNMGIQAGHAIGGRAGAVLLDEELIRPQDYHCNVGLRGNYPVFVTKLIREKAREIGASSEIGTPPAEPIAAAMEWWEGKLAASRQVRKWNRQDLEEKIESYKARLNGL